MNGVRRLSVFLVGFGVVLWSYLFWSDGLTLQRQSMGAVVLYVVFSGALIVWLSTRGKRVSSTENGLSAESESAYDESGKPRRPTEVISMSNRIFSILSHEIRTPVTAIASSTQVLKQGLDKLSDERRETHLRNIQVAVDRIQGLMDGVTLVTQSEQGKLPFVPRPVDLLAFCQSTVDQLEAHQETSRIRLQYDDRIPQTLSLDENLLRHMLYNLLSNALKYSGEKAPVEFVVERQDEFLEFKVSDRGIGIPDEDHGRLFESFYRASNASGIQGTGLGLNIAKRAVEAHGGTISYESKEGVGSAFMVCLPLT